MNVKKIISAVLAALMLIGTLSMGMTVSAAESITYSDVNDGMWSYGDIMYVSENGLMNGTGGTTFSPFVDVTRSMVVTVLYRMEGSPEVKFNENAYADVTAGEFYSEAVIWAQENGIVTSTGMNEFYEDLFAPARAITRQELATMFVRYAEYRYVITEKQADISGFKDIADVADWASKAMAWCNEAGLIKGTGSGDTLSPKLTATREQFAAIIHRFKEAEFDYQYIFNTPRPLSTFTEPEYPLVDYADLYVAVDGSDTNPGTLEKPLATFEKAAEKVRELKKTAKDEIVVAFKAGNYGNLQLELTEEDSGSEEIPITYCKYGDGDVVFSNAVKISLDEFKPIEESDKYLFTDKFEGDIFKADISDRVNEGDLTGFNIMYHDVNNVSMQSARFPNKTLPEKDMYINGVTDKVLGPAGESGKESIITLGPALSNRFDKYHTYENITVIGQMEIEYWAEYELVQKYDKETKELYLTSIDAMNAVIWGDNSVFVQNVSEELDFKGEYWIDIESQTLYVYKPDSNYSLAVKPTLISFKNAEYITVKGIDFKHSTSRAVDIESNHVTVSQAEIMGTYGDYAIGVNGYYNTVRDSELHHLAGGGILLKGGDWQMLTPSNNLVDNNSIHDYEQIFQTYRPGLWLKNSVGARVSHNEIYNAPHSAIIYGNGEDDLNVRAIDNVIEYNYIHDVLNTHHGDAGAIYTRITQTDRGNIVRYNIITSIGGSGSCWGIYLDDGISGQEVYGNVFCNSIGPSVMMSGGRDNMIYDNIGIGTQDSPWELFSYCSALSINAKWADMLEENGKEITSGNWKACYSYTLSRYPKEGEARKIWEERWPEFFEAIADPTISFDRLDDPTMMANSAGCVIKNNYAFGNVPDHSISSKNVQKFNTFENNLSFKDYTGPEIFVNPAYGDYTLRDDCELTFVNGYDYSKIGRY